MDIRLFQHALTAASEQVRVNLPYFGTAFPLPCTERGVYPAGINTDWTTGFYTGMCWLAYEATGDTMFREAAAQQVQSFADRLKTGENVEHHDMGFLYTPSCVAAWKLIGDPVGRDAALAAARKLMGRFQPVGQFFQAWGRPGDPSEYRLIIDCLLNLPLLYWASEETGDPLFSQRADAHTATAAKTLFRPDGSTAHTCYMNPATGEPARVMTAQGYRADSAWARGQAWGVYGMALACRRTGNPGYRQIFRRTLRFFLDRLPDDRLPYWDLVFRTGDEPRDSSAAAIAVCGMYEMLPLLPKEEAAEALAAADEMLLALTRLCTVPVRPGGGLLAHGVYCKASPYNTVKDYGVDECNLWGDYFYMEALVRRTRRWEPYW
ncbi:MAG: glycoside hydrolase family 88 protein [Gemmiger sp.]